MHDSNHIAVLLTCHNRKAQTLACLAALYAQQLPDGVVLETFLVDDGCTDGTAVAIAEAYPQVRIIPGDGSLFWCRGMRLAWEHAAATSPDAYLWLNDDTLLLPGAVSSLMAVWRDAVMANRPNTIVIGWCRDPVSGEHTYGGQRRVGGHPLVLEPVLPGDQPTPCDTFNGNSVLVPREVFRRVGLIGRFQHAMGDTDYGYRAIRAGCQCVVAPGYLGTCASNPNPTYWHKGRCRLERWRLLSSRKGLPPRDWLRFASRHGGPLWPMYWARPYLRVLLNR